MQERGGFAYLIGDIWELGLELGGLGNLLLRGSALA